MEGTRLTLHERRVREVCGARIVRLGRCDHARAVGHGDAARTADRAQQIAVVRKALGDRSGFVVAKAAAVAAGAMLGELEADLGSALARLLAAPADDPNCTGKTALVKALRDLEGRDPAPFLAGLAHVQLESVFGGKVDTAGPLRAASAGALVATTIDPGALMVLLVDRLVDVDKWVRIDVARAIEHLGRPESALVLRLRALCGDPDPEVIGQCLASLLALEPQTASPFVATFFDHAEPEVKIEAIGALALARSPAAFDEIERFWTRTRDPELRRAVIAALAGSTFAQTPEFLLDIAGGDDDGLAIAALASLAASRFRNEARTPAAAAVARTGGTAVRRAFEQHFGALT